MKTEPSQSVAPAAITLLAPAARRLIFVYLAVLIVLVAFGDPNGGLMDISISFMLKNKLNLSAQEVARFRLAAALPLYLAGVFGFLRDRWNPFGRKDRGFLALFGALCCGLYLTFAFTPLSAAMLLAAVLLLTCCFLFISSALNGLASTLGQQHAMSGRISALWSAFVAVPGVAAFLLGGRVSELLEGQDTEEAVRPLFLAGAAILATICLYSLWRPKAVFDNLVDEEPRRARALDDLKRLARHAPIYPALAIWLFWNFAPGAQTPLQFHIQNQLHAPDRVWGEWNAIFAASFIPPFILYGYICRWFALKKLLFWGTLIAVPQFVPLLFAQSATGALIAAAPMGFMGGVATAAYLDLLIRSAPPGLQGATLMLSGGLYYIAGRFGDVLGTVLYERFGGFAICVGMITLVYASIFLLIRLAPEHLVAAADGEAVAGEDGRDKTALSLPKGKS